MIEELDGVLEGNGQLGLPELRRSLQELLGGPSATGRVLDQHFVTRIKRDRHCQIIRHRGAGGSDDTINWRPGMASQPFLERLVSVSSGPGDLHFRPVKWKLTDAGTR